MPKVRLLERMRDTEAGRPGPYQDSAVLSSISGYLVKLLNTHQGSVLQDPSYGIPDIILLTSSFGMEQKRDLERILSRVIAGYEPRLKNVEVSYMPDDSRPLIISFRISGDFGGARAGQPVLFETRIVAGNRIEVQRVA
jgi:type VI secretion system protein